MKYIYILGTIFFVVIGQIMLKWQINKYILKTIIDDNRIKFYQRLLVDPVVIISLLCGAIAAVFWISALTKFELSDAYPFVGLTFALVLLLSTVIFNEPLNAYKVTGVFFIIAGIVISSRGM